MSSSSSSSSSTTSSSGPAVVCKLILLGNGSIGKTSICNRFKDDGFKRVYRQTVGVDFYEKTIPLRGKDVALQVWDIGGQSLASSMMSRYIRGASVIFLCYDVTDPSSFADLEDWLSLVRKTEKEEAQEAAAASISTPRPAALYLVGNKIDLEHLRKVAAPSHDRFVSLNKLQGGFYLSARSGENVLTAFYTAAAAHLGVHLSEAEVEATKKVLGVVVAAGKDEARTAFADEIERADREAAERRRRREESGCCGVM
jgi:Ras-related protein Rab-28